MGGGGGRAVELNETFVARTFLSHTVRTRTEQTLQDSAQRTKEAETTMCHPFHHHHGCPAAADATNQPTT